MKQSKYLILVAFFAGIVLANLMGQELLVTYGILNTYFLEQYKYGTIGYDRLFGQIFLERLKVALLLVVAGNLVKGKLLFGITESVMAATFGFLLVAAITNLGMRGMIIVLCALLPQWVVYLTAIIIYFLFLMKREESPANYGRRGIQIRHLSEYAVIYMLLLLLVLVGILLETYVNPVFLRQILKII